MISPAGQPVRRTVDVNGIKLAFHEWGGSTEGSTPTLLFAHATGFHGRVFDAVIERMIERLPGARVLAVDLRGHGSSTGGPIDDWRTASDDVTALIDQLDIRDAIGIGHSMGAHILIQCGADRTAAFRQLVLFDPVILAPEYYGPHNALFTSDNPHPAIRRKRDFASPEAMMERFGPREPYSLFDARVFEDYCRHGLRAREGGGYELACSPETEASIYASSTANAGIHDAARSLAMPVLVVRARQTGLKDFTSSPTWPDLASTMPHGIDLHRPDRTHFHPFEDPADAARIICGAIDD